MGKVTYPTIMTLVHLFTIIIYSFNRPNQILAELQVAFLCFLIGQVYSAFEHWKNLIKILCFADVMILQNPSLFMEFTGDLYFQVYNFIFESLQKLSIFIFFSIDAGSFSRYVCRYCVFRKLFNSNLESFIPKCAGKC